MPEPELREAEARRQRRREQLIRFGVMAGVVVVVLVVGRRGIRQPSLR